MGTEIQRYKRLKDSGNVVELRDSVRSEEWGSSRGCWIVVYERGELKR